MSAGRVAPPVRERGDGRKPAWLKKPLPEVGPLRRMEVLLRVRNLHTVCDSALCPNLGSCFGHGTATFLIMGDVCTRACGFCAVGGGAPGELDLLEPEHVADAAVRLGLRHVVVTSVTRDDLTDGGAAHYVATIRAIRERLPEATIEVLVPDFAGRWESAELVLSEKPDVFNHNVETVPRLYQTVRPQAEYGRSLALLRRAASRGSGLVKTGCMVGLGETEGEVQILLEQVAETGVAMVTIGQYLRPSVHNLPVAEYVNPSVFERYREWGEALGLQVQAGPFVRSSFQAGESFAQALTRVGKDSDAEIQ
jgi:lipoic acid synthetase